MSRRTMVMEIMKIILGVLLGVWVIIALVQSRYTEAILVLILLWLERTLILLEEIRDELRLGFRNWEDDL